MILPITFHRLIFTIPFLIWYYFWCLFGVSIMEKKHAKWCKWMSVIRSNRQSAIELWASITLKQNGSYFKTMDSTQFYRLCCIGAQSLMFVVWHLSLFDHNQCRCWTPQIDTNIKLLIQMKNKPLFETLWLPHQDAAKRFQCHECSRLPNSIYVLAIFVTKWY